MNRSGLDYHGYHAYDWTQVDPRLESADASYQDFITAAHGKGLKVVQDVVINHSSQYGIRGKVFIDHLPIKYYRPAGGAPIANGPYQGNLGDLSSRPLRERCAPTSRGSQPNRWRSHNSPCSSSTREA